jgi:putative FmdB family regulatory protein
MPLYDYTCSKCGHMKEIQRKMADRNKRTKCPECGGRMRIAFTKAEFMLIGGGWSGTSHPIIHPPTEPAPPPVPTNYYNCTPESVHKQE